MCDVRIKMYETARGSSVRISFHDGKGNLIGDRIKLMAKGHRLYFIEGTDGHGYKLNQHGAVCIYKEAMDIRKFEGEYSLEFDGDHYYVDKDKVMPLTSYNYESRLGMSYQSSKRTIQDVSRVNNIIKEEVEMVPDNKIETPVSNEVNTNLDNTMVVTYLKNQALLYLLDDMPESAQILAKAVKILEVK